MVDDIGDGGDSPEERHEVLSGTLRGRVGGQERDYAEGERVVGPAGVPHAWRNASSEEELRIISEIRRKKRKKGEANPPPLPPPPRLSLVGVGTHERKLRAIRGDEFQHSPTPIAQDRRRGDVRIVGYYAPAARIAAEQSSVHRAGVLPDLIQIAVNGLRRTP